MVYGVMPLLGRGWVVFQADPLPPYATEIVSDHETEEAAQAVVEELQNAN